MSPEVKRASTSTSLRGRRRARSRARLVPEAEVLLARGHCREVYPAREPRPAVRYIRLVSSPRSAILPVLGAAAVVLLAASTVRELAEPYRPDSTSETARRRLLRDDYEMSVYVRRGSLAPAGARPYLDVFSEYPQLA